MDTADSLRRYCKELREKREEELKTVLDDYFCDNFIAEPRPFRAVLGNKKCKPIPVYKKILEPCKAKNESCFYQWPNFSEELLRQELENLGFVVTKNKISIMVPPYEKGKELSFAQEWVRKINQSYSKYCASQKKFADKMYSKYVLELLSINPERIKTYQSYTLFCDFEFGYRVSPKCETYIKRLMMRDGIEPYYEDGKYRGIKVYNSLKIN